ncbi:MAG: 30S ribosomal protein S17 [Candidatus Omnitrophica bacterium]|nr:30S ribosomal protein S17 [Candidatus Omnitrophota bacterium]MBU4149247.1 30S ribosomal protein S17 [Candidatus Omnitrophota bacterium]
METRGRMKIRTGTVISDKISKTIVIRVDRTTKHAKYKRVVKKSSKVMVHDEKNEAKIGDKVRVRETRPLSKNKKWKLIEVIK